MPANRIRIPCLSSGAITVGASHGTHLPSWSGRRLSSSSLECHDLRSLWTGHATDPLLSARRPSGLRMVVYSPFDGRCWQLAQLRKVTSPVLRGGVAFTPTWRRWRARAAGPGPSPMEPIPSRRRTASIPARSRPVSRRCLRPGTIRCNATANRLTSAWPASDLN